MSYTFSSTPRASGDVDAEPLRELKSDGSACEQVISGVSLRDENGDAFQLCERDIGDSCLEQIKSQAGDRSRPSVMEDKLKEQLASLERKKARIAKRKEEGKEQDA